MTKESRRRGFSVVGEAARSCATGEGYISLVNRVNGLISSTAPGLWHHWGQFGGSGEQRAKGRKASTYSGLRNQGCTCYMNMCSAPLPSTLRSSGSATPNAGVELVGKKVSLQWDTAASYDAIVESFDESTGMHAMRYCPIQVATVNPPSHEQVKPEDISHLPPT